MLLLKQILLVGPDNSIAVVEFNPYSLLIILQCS